MSWKPGKTSTRRGGFASDSHHRVYCPADAASLCPEEGAVVQVACGGGADDAGARHAGHGAPACTFRRPASRRRSSSTRRTPHTARPQHVPPGPPPEQRELHPNQLDRREDQVAARRGAGLCGERLLPAVRPADEDEHPDNQNALDRLLASTGRRSRTSTTRRHTTALSRRASRMSPMTSIQSDRGARSPPSPRPTQTGKKCQTRCT